MLVTRELTKIYKPKKGVPVTALDKVTLTFPDTGMVFLLGKSGSGKSTLLNVLGGLDRYDSGEITIKGVSSKSFTQSHFDSYRNTYVGFIFQEYNVLDEFTVGANIALAIELQNRKAKDEEINRILHEVDLDGYGNRKPNELSGGQKQRVAIARALVKNPEIIMADEPSGALDSTTGKQIFDTLKNLSASKLVIVVSHDREFAEQYADRIIELSDGNVISDVERISWDSSTLPEESAQTLAFHDHTVEIPAGYHLTEEDRRAINEYIEQLHSGITNLRISGNKQKSAQFAPTDTTRIRTHNGSAFQLIKSKLPWKNAFKIGSGALKYKKFRLVMTILLSCIAFSLFGFSDTFGSYNHIRTCTDSLMDSNMDYAAVTKEKKEVSGGQSWWRGGGYLISESERKEISKSMKTEMIGVYQPEFADLRYSMNTNPEITLEGQGTYNIFTKSFSGYAQINDAVLEEFGYRLLAGKLPDGKKDEIAISELVFDSFKRFEYTEYREDAENEKPVYQKINSYEDMVGKTLYINGKTLTVTGIIDTKFDMERYAPLTEEKKDGSNADMVLDYVLYNEFNTAKLYGMSNNIMVGEGYVQKMLEGAPPVARISEDNYIIFEGEPFNFGADYLGKLKDYSDGSIIWTEGEKSSLAENEIVIPESILLWNDDKPGASTEKDTDPEKRYKTMLSGKNNVNMGYYIGNGERTERKCKIVGVLKENEQYRYLSATVICDDQTVEALTGGSDGIYAHAVGPMPKTQADIQKLVEYCYREDTDVRFHLNNPVTFELDTIHELLTVLAKVFLYIGIGFAIFAAVMLANFIATSISYKKQEIGILRAIGSRSNDVFRIFFAESFIIAMINFILSSVGVFVLTNVINNVMRKETGILITILHFGVRQLILLFAVSIFVAAAASFLPVWKIASKRPIDAIRNR